MLSPTAGVLFSNQIASVVMRYFEWRTVFTAVGISAIILAVFVLIFMKDTGKSSKGHTFMEGLRYITGNKDIMRMAMVGFCLMWVQIGFISWANTAIKSCGLTLANGAFIMTLFGVGGIVGPLVSGVLADRTSNKKILMVIGFGSLIPLVLGFGAVNTLTPMAVTACALGFVFGYINTFMPLMVSEYSGPQWAASAGGVTGCIFQTGAILGPAILGFAIDMTGSFQAIWWLLAAGPIAGTFFLISLQSPKAHPVAA
jgi:predicted MFS family arabinose efflux permease